MKNQLVMKIPFIRLLKIAGIMIFSNIIFAPGVKVENWNQPHLLHKIESSQNKIVIFFFDDFPTKSTTKSTIIYEEHIYRKSKILKEQ